MATIPGGSLTLAPDFTVSRMGFGAMQLAGPGVWGPPKNVPEAQAVLREVVEQGVNHIDTSDFYGPFTVNQLIRDTLYPYPADLRIVTKVGALRGPDASWNPALSRQELIDAVHSNLRNLKLDVLDVVNLRVGAHEEPTPGSIAPQFEVLAELQQQGLIRHLGLSGVNSDQLTEAQGIAPVVTVQNLYNIARREDEELVQRCAREGIGYTPFFPLGGFTPLQSEELNGVAARLGLTPQTVALAWLLQHSPTILLIPGTSSVVHLRENLAAATVTLPAEAIAELDRIASEK